MLCLAGASVCAPNVSIETYLSISSLAVAIFLGFQDNVYAGYVPLCVTVGFLNAENTGISCLLDVRFYLVYKPS